MLRRFQIFLGPRRYKAFVALLAATGFGSLALTLVADDAPGATSAQTLLLAAFVAGGSWLILGRLPREERFRWLAIILPAAIGVVIASLLLPHLTGLFVGAGLGWIVAGIFVFNSFGASQDYKRAVKAMRRGAYPDAIESISAQIRRQPERGEHYRFRAELYRLAGKLAAARRDYQKMIELDEENAVGWNGLAEVELQARRYAQAREAGKMALELAPEQWVAAYNLGLIDDRVGDSAAAIAHLGAALEKKIPDSRHRLLAHLYLARAAARMGDAAMADAALRDMKREKAGLEEWRMILQQKEAAALRDVLSGDIELAGALVKGEADLDGLAGVK